MGVTARSATLSKSRSTGKNLTIPPASFFCHRLGIFEFEARQLTLLGLSFTPELRCILSGRGLVL